MLHASQLVTIVTTLYIMGALLDCRRLRLATNLCCMLCERRCGALFTHSCAQTPLLVRHRIPIHRIRHARASTRTLRRRTPSHPRSPAHLHLRTLRTSLAHTLPLPLIRPSLRPRNGQQHTPPLLPSQPRCLPVPCSQPLTTRSTIDA